MRRPLFIVAVVALGLAVVVEVGLGGRVTQAVAGGPVLQAKEAFQGAPEDVVLAQQRGVSVVDKPDSLPRPGKGIPALAFIDAMLWVLVLLQVIALFVPGSVQGRVQGIGTLIGSIILVLVSFFAILVNIALVMLMIGLLLATPFGTLAYLAIWGHFDVGAAQATLGVVLLLKLVFAVLLVISNPKFLATKSLVLLVLTSLVLSVLTSFLIGFPPTILASITDVFAAIVSQFLALIWAVVLLVFSLVAVIRILRLRREAGTGET